MPVNDTIIRQQSYRQFVERLRWDHGDTLSFNNGIFYNLQPVFHELLDIEKAGFRHSDISLIDLIYGRITEVLNSCAAATIPSCKQNFLRFWWSQELACLKQESIDSNQLWKAAGRPRSWAIHEGRNKARRAYRNGIRKHETQSTEAYYYYYYY